MLDRARRHASAKVGAANVPPQGNGLDVGGSTAAIRVYHGDFVVYYWTGEATSGYALGEVVPKQTDDEAADDEVVVVPYRHRTGQRGGAWASYEVFRPTRAFATRLKAGSSKYADRERVSTQALIYPLQSAPHHRIRWGNRSARRLTPDDAKAAARAVQDDQEARARRLDEDRTRANAPTSEQGGHSIQQPKGRLSISENEKDANSQPTAGGTTKHGTHTEEPQRRQQHAQGEATEEVADDENDEAEGGAEDEEQSPREDPEEVEKRSMGGAQEQAEELGDAALSSASSYSESMHSCSDEGSSTSSGTSTDDESVYRRDQWQAAEGWLSREHHTTGRESAEYTQKLQDMIRSGVRGIEGQRPAWSMVDLEAKGRRAAIALCGGCLARLIAARTEQEVKVQLLRRRGRAQKQKQKAVTAEAATSGGTAAEVESFVARSRDESRTLERARMGVVIRAAITLEWEWTARELTLEDATGFRRERFRGCRRHGDMLLPPRSLRAWFRRHMQGGLSVAALLSGPTALRIHRCRNEQYRRECRMKVAPKNNIEVDMEGAPEVESVLQLERVPTTGPSAASGGREARTRVAAAQAEHARRKRTKRQRRQRAVGVTSVKVRIEVHMPDRKRYTRTVNPKGTVEALTQRLVSKAEQQQHQQQQQQQQQVSF